MHFTEKELNKIVEDRLARKLSPPGQSRRLPNLAEKIKQIAQKNRGILPR